MGERSEWIRSRACVRSMEARDGRERVSRGDVSEDPSARMRFGG